jgi:hypothetical protein
MPQQPLADRGLLTVEASRSHSDTLHSVGLLWTSDQPDAETYNLTTHNTPNRQTSMPLAEFELAILASEKMQTHALERAATGIGTVNLYSTRMWTVSRHLTLPMQISRYRFWNKTMMIWINLGVRDKCKKTSPIF